MDAGFIDMAIEAQVLRDRGLYESVILIRLKARKSRTTIAHGRHTSLGVRSESVFGLEYQLGSNLGDSRNC